MLWILIRGASNEYPQHMFLSRNKTNIDTFWLKKKKHLIKSYIRLVEKSEKNISSFLSEKAVCLDL